MRFALIWLAVVSLFGGEPIAGISATVYFSPGGGCTNAIVAVLAEAKQTVLVQAYSLTSTPIAKALAAAKARSVDLRGILGKSQRHERKPARASSSTPESPCSSTSSPRSRTRRS